MFSDKSFCNNTKLINISVFTSSEIDQLWCIFYKDILIENIKKKRKHKGYMCMD